MFLLFILAFFTYFPPFAVSLYIYLLQHSSRCITKSLFRLCWRINPSFFHTFQRILQTTPQGKHFFPFSFQLELYKTYGCWERLQVLLLTSRLLWEEHIRQPNVNRLFIIFFFNITYKRNFFFLSFPLNHQHLILLLYNYNFTSSFQ